MFIAKVKRYICVFRVLLFSLIFILFSSAALHKFYVSTTKIEYVEKTQSVQIISKIFIDDLEKVLRKKYDESIVLGSENEHEKDLVKMYVLENLNININGTPVELEYIGKEYEIDLLKVYIEINNISNFSSIEIENVILFDLFNEQKNIIHLNTGKSKRSMVLTRENPKGMLNF